MASLKFLLLVVVIANAFFSAYAIEMKNAEEPLQDVKEPSLSEGDNGVVSTEEEIPEEAVSPGEVLLNECANMHIKSCEQQRQCRQVICPTETLEEVSFD